MIFKNKVAEIYGAKLSSLLESFGYTRINQYKSRNKFDLYYCTLEYGYVIRYFAICYNKGKIIVTMKRYNNVDISSTEIIKKVKMMLKNLNSIKTILNINWFLLEFPEFAKGDNL